MIGGGGKFTSLPFCGDDGRGCGVENSVRSEMVERRRYECEDTGDTSKLVNISTLFCTILMGHCPHVIIE
jgi:hypothetical protein